MNVNNQYEDSPAVDMEKRRVVLASGRNNLLQRSNIAIRESQTIELPNIDNMDKQLVAERQLEL